ncbi:MAG: hypothetical protein IKF72_02145, partial [Kiritimatiellae bacterium]|nr:hypothetical protein [Kiritimatiellia bacterium]
DGVRAAFGVDLTASATSMAAKPSEFRKNRAGLSEGSTAFPKGGDIPADLAIASVPSDLV